MVANDTTLHKKPNDTVINIYWSLYGLKQSGNHILHNQL